MTKSGSGLFGRADTEGYLMKKAFLTLFSLLLAAVFVLGSCGQNAVPAETAEDTAQTYETVPLSSGSGTYIVSSVEKLKALEPAEDTAIVILRGYYSAEDGGGGTFYYDRGSRESADDGLVFEGVARGRFVRSCDKSDLNVKWFGATGNGEADDTAAIQAAIDALPPKGGTVRVPGGNYKITSTIRIGDGDANEKVSTKAGVKFIGEGGGFAHNTPASTVFTAANEMESMVCVTGRISDVEIAGIYLGGNGKAEECLRLHSFAGSYFHNITAIGFTKIGINVMGGGYPVGNYNIYNRFESIASFCLYDGGTALKMDGDATNNNDTWLTVLTDCRFDCTQTKDSTAAHLAFVDSISFYRCHFSAYNSESTGILFDAMSKPFFPCGIGFYDCSVTRIKIREDDAHQIRPQYFYGFGTEDGEEIPLDSRLRGITDHGETFNMDALDVFRGGGHQAPEQPDDGGIRLPAKGGRNYTYGFTFDGTSEVKTHYNLKQGKVVACLVNVKGTFKSLIAYLSSYGNAIGSITASVYKWDGDYNKTLKGAVLASATITDFPDNANQQFDFEGLGSGYYLIVMTGTGPADDYGVAVWTKKRLRLRDHVR